MEIEDNAVIQTTEFVSRSCGGAARPKGGASPRSKHSRRRRDHPGAAYFLIRLGVCAAIFCGVLAVKLHGDDEAIAVIGKAAFDDEAGSEEETLGRLKFVELPSIIDVFAPSDKAVLPANASSYSVEEEGRALVLSVNAGESAVSPAAGRVLDVGESEELGGFVSISVSDDISFTVSGLRSVGVERGQPVKQRQKLGEAGEKLTVRVYEAGRPIDPETFFSMGDRLR